jgi:3-deoxy-7-phosphoheptulonate synthase
MEMVEEIPRSAQQLDVVARSRSTLHEIIQGRDKRLIGVVGPCSIHDLQACREYAEKFIALSQELENRLFLLMRVYFEKPRTTVGWKGLIMDPQLNGTCDIPAGLRIARSFLGEVLDLGIPTATELLDPITPQYLADSLSWAAIGARTSESQTHRQMASGLSMPVGFKNATSGDLKAAVNGIIAATQSQTFLGITEDGRASAVTTGGNPDCQLILRGGSAGPNYSSVFVEEAGSSLRKVGAPCSLMVDCSHANSEKDPSRQPEVLESVLNQVADGANTVHAFMLESHLQGGSQTFPRPLNELEYGVSITDGCIDWPTTEACLRRAAEVVDKVRFS